jgi:hypothetical protein
MMGSQIVSRSMDGLRSGAPIAAATAGGFGMRYMVAWMLGVPFSVIVLWYIVGHSACG